MGQRSLLILGQVFRFFFSTATGNMAAWQLGNLATWQLGGFDAIAFEIHDSDKARLMA